MTNSRLILAFILGVQLVGSQAMAAWNLPNLEGLTSLAGSTVFLSPKAISWHLAADFRPSFVCSASISGGHQLCSLTILNIAPIEAREQMAALGSGPGSGVASLTALENSVIKEITESLGGDILRYTPASFRFPRTLAMNERTPYLNLLLRTEGGEGERLMEKFMSDGLGVFESKIELMAESLGDFLAIRDPKLFGDVMIGIERQSLTRESALGGLRRAISAGSLVFQGMTESEARAVTETVLFSRIFKKTNGLYRIKANVLNALLPQQAGNPLILSEQSSGPIPVLCTVSVSLRKNAAPVVNCATREDIQ